MNAGAVAFPEEDGRRPRRLWDVAKVAVITLVGWGVLAHAFGSVVLYSYHLKDRFTATTGTITAVDAHNHNMATVVYDIGGRRFQMRAQATTGIGRQVNVYYDPAEPGRATLRHPIHAFNSDVQGLVAAASVWLLIAIVAVWLGGAR